MDDRADSRAVLEAIEVSNNNAVYLDSYDKFNKKAGRAYVTDYLPQNTPYSMRCTPNRIKTFTTFFDFGVQLQSALHMRNNTQDIHLYQKLSVAVRGVRLRDIIGVTIGFALEQFNPLLSGGARAAANRPDQIETVFQPYVQGDYLRPNITGDKEFLPGVTEAVMSRPYTSWETFLVLLNTDSHPVVYVQVHTEWPHRYAGVRIGSGPQATYHDFEVKVSPMAYDLTTSIADNLELWPTSTKSPYALYLRFGYGDDFMKRVSVNSPRYGPVQPQVQSRRDHNQAVYKRLLSYFESDVLPVLEKRIFPLRSPLASEENTRWFQSRQLDIEEFEATFHRYCIARNLEEFW